ncbi:ribonuclease HII [Thiomicrorhabdus xiamenensis]|uniref:Ribonuclease HII n=1 Tax=Thiomicrorhabdus xiamenensis TaxID=2739063 RepID=A0A7D4TE85_9GAMM|nr:ribonuclease HII [Thiomicrorhabdus xiamenensis]QKI89227.1 ribonuclease HII [Thiomicrorhabdus xiamenensis]
MKNTQQIDLFANDSPEDSQVIIGVDEVGRGPLIGDVVAAAVILPDDCSLPLADSKKLSEKKRELLFDQICEQAVAYSIQVASPEEIDELNILQATMLAMTRAIESVASQSRFDLVMVDGNRCPDIKYPCQSVIKGDAKIKAISAASILAKVYRDRQMIELDQRYPEYGFAKHKGYPTAEHMSRLQNLPVLEQYRRSFKPVRLLLEQS